MQSPVEMASSSLCETADRRHRAALSVAVSTLLCRINRSPPPAMSLLAEVGVLFFFQMCILPHIHFRSARRMLDSASDRTEDACLACRPGFPINFGFLAKHRPHMMNRQQIADSAKLRP